MVAAFFVHPIDTVKVRMQMPKTSQTIKYSSLNKSMNLIFREEGLGPKGLYKGLSAALLRESTYSAMRLGFYVPIKRALGATDPKSTPFWIKFTAGGLAGLLGSGIANPLDLIKTRM